jgi:hypothetical protein
VSELPPAPAAAAADGLAADPGPAAAPPPRPRFAPSRAWRLALLGITSFGLYFVVWAARAGRVVRDRRGRGIHPAWWGVALLVPFLGAYVLYRIGREARACAAERERRAPAGHVAAAGIALLLPAIQIVHPSLTSLLATVAFPIPFLLVQRQMNAAWDEAEALPRRFTWPQRAVLVLGVVAMVLLVRVLRPLLVSLVGQEVAAGTHVSGLSGAYSLEVPAAHWVRLHPGTYGDAAADLELAVRGWNAWVVVYVRDGRAQSIDDVVDARRNLILRGAHRFFASERRFFLDPPDALVPASEALYARPFFLGLAGYTVEVAHPGSRIIEVIGFTAVPALRDQVRRTVESLHLVPGTTR